MFSFSRVFVASSLVACVSCATDSAISAVDKHVTQPVGVEVCSERALAMAEALYRLAYGSAAEYLLTEPVLEHDDASAMRYSVYIEDARTHQDNDACAEACNDRYSSETYTVAMNAGTCRVKSVSRDGAGQDVTQNPDSPNRGKCTSVSRNAASEAYDISNGESAYGTLFIDEFLADGANDRNSVTHVSFSGFGHDQPQDGYLVVTDAKTCLVNHIGSHRN